MLDLAKEVERLILARPPPAVQRIVNDAAICADFVVRSNAPAGCGREAILSGQPLQNGTTALPVCGADSPALTRSAAADGRRWLAADCGLTDTSSRRGLHWAMNPADLQWSPGDQLWSWDAAPPTPRRAPHYAKQGDALTLVVSDTDKLRVSVGEARGFVHCPTLACTGGRRTRDIVGLYTCDSVPGDCGSLVFADCGVVGLHCGTLVFGGERLNAYYPFLLNGHEPAVVSDAVVESCQRQSGAGSSALVRRPSTREAGIVGMSAAPSDLPSRRNNAAPVTVQAYVDLLVNAWGGAPVRLPDTVVIATCVSRFVANRTYTIANVAANGGNFLFGTSSRLNGASTTQPIELGSSYVNSAPPAPYIPIPAYSYSPGNILSPLQHGAGAYADPVVKMAVNSPNATGGGVWGDDYGAAFQATLGFMAAYRTLSMGIRVRIIGLPSGQFMTPGKIYFAQVRGDHTDLPVTEQDFVNMEQFGRASHVSADAVRESGSKTVFFTPDGAQKFHMQSNFLPACGVFTGAEVSAPASGPFGVRAFPGVVPGPGGFIPTDFTRNIIPYSSRGDTSGGAISPPLYATALGDALDSSNADATSYLFVAYFGAIDGVVLEVDYATVVEYIPNRGAASGLEAVVQLPNTPAMDAIFSAAAVLTEAKPVMIQAPGDLTITSSTRSSVAAPESLRARSALSSFASRVAGTAYRESFWDFDWLKKGNVGPINWDFTGGGSAAPRAARAADVPRGATRRRAKRESRASSRRSSVTSAASSAAPSTALVAFAPARRAASSRSSAPVPRFPSAAGARGHRRH